MIKDLLKDGVVEIQAIIKKPEKLLNYLWKEKINVSNVRRLDINTIQIKVDYIDYIKVLSIIKELGGKGSIVKRGGALFLVLNLRKRISLVIGVLAFFVVLYILSTYIWAIEIQTGTNVAPFEIRKELEELGIKPGISKSNVDVYKLEKDLPNKDGEIMWMWARIEGSTLKVKIEEKINPPKTYRGSEGEILARMGGEIIRIYSKDGKPAVEKGDIVKEGDVLIYPYMGTGETEYEVEPEGTALANTFYEKEMEIQISGEKLQRTGEKERDIYLNLMGRKIYLKKVINQYEYYDKIEVNNGIYNEVIYFKKDKKQISLNKEKTINDAEKKLEDSLRKSLTNTAKIKDKKTRVEDVGEGKIRVIVDFVVEQVIS